MAPVSSIVALNCNISYAACCGLQRSRTAVAYCACRDPVRPWPTAACRHPVRPRHAAACGEFLSGVYCNKSPPRANPPRPKIRAGRIAMRPALSTSAVNPVRRTWPYTQIPSSMTMHVGAWSRSRCGRFGRRARDADVIRLVAQHNDPTAS